MSMGNAYQYILSTGKTVCDARNVGLTTGVERDYDKVMFWDDDVIPREPEYAMQKLSVALDVYPEIDVIGGIYPMKGNENMQLPIVEKEKDQPVWWGFEDGGLHQVYMTATGFTMFRMSSLRKLTGLMKYDIDGMTVTKYFDVDKDARTDDFYFARMAKQQGLTWYVHGGVICDQVELDGRLYKYENSKPPEIQRAWLADKPLEKP